MQTVQRERADALLEARSVRPISELANTVADDDSPFNAFIGLLLGLVVSLPLWAAVAVAIFLILR
jgi:hypothetical protein